MTKAASDNDRTMIRFDRNHMILIYCLCGFFILAVGFKIHGYSISILRDYIDGSKKADVLIGSDKPIRSDDWAVEIPLMLAQLAHNPKYPLINENVGTGLNMLVNSKVAILHPLTFFKPTVWGFFLGPDYGLSWMWWSMVIGMFYVYFLVFMIVSRNDFYLSSTASLFLLFSPFFQFWSFHMAEIPIFLGIIFVCFAYVCFDQNTKIIIVHGVVLGWALGCFAFNFVYPPYQISCSYLLLCMMIALIIDRRREYNIRKEIVIRFITLILALTILGYAGSIYYSTMKQVIEIIMNTEYPGSRFYTGGDQNPGIFFKNNILITLLYFNLSGIDWGGLGNICEASSFLFFFPPIMMLLIWMKIVRKTAVDSYSLILMIYFAMMLIYIFFGFPRSISKYSLFYMMPSSRSVIGLGIANAVLIVSFLSRSYSKNSTYHIERIVISVCWGILIGIAGAQIRKIHPAISLSYTVGICLISGTAAYFLLDADHKKKMIALLAGICFICTFSFNPVVMGGTGFIYKNELSQKIQAIDRENDGNTCWAIFGSWVTANLFRMIGVKSLNGTHSHPMLALWEKYDPQHQYFSEYNRFAHVSFEPSAENELHFHSPSDDLLTVYVNPSSSFMEDMGITHVLVFDQYAEFFNNTSKFEKLFTTGNKIIYQIR